MSTAVAIPKDEVCQDKHVFELKSKQMERMRWSSMLTSVSRMATFMAGVLLAAGMALIAPALKGAETMSAAWGAATASPVGMTFLIVAGIATVAAVATDYVSSRIWQSSSFDNVEINAQRVAENLVSKMKENNMCMTQEHSQNCRADGKSWLQATGKDKLHEVLNPVRQT